MFFVPVTCFIKIPPTIDCKLQAKGNTRWGPSESPKLWISKVDMSIKKKGKIHSSKWNFRYFSLKIIVYFQCFAHLHFRYINWNFEWRQNDWIFSTTILVWMSNEYRGLTATQWSLCEKTVILQHYSRGGREAAAGRSPRVECGVSSESAGSQLFIYRFYQQQPGSLSAS